MEIKKLKTIPESFEFLSDEPLSEFNEDRLEHLSIATSLERIIRKCPMPFTIGLFGKWGTGKSTISNFLGKQLSRKNSKIAVVKFDVWKYENDSLKRFFLLSLSEELKKQDFLDQKFELNERVESSISRSFEGAPRISWAKITQFKFAFFAFVLAIIAVIVQISVGQSSKIPETYLTSVFNLSLVSSAILFLFRVGSEIFTTETKTLSQERFNDAEQFETEFIKIIKRSDAERILIVIDNLDRCIHSKAVELLSTIKTFLGRKNQKCIFLVQCDEEAIKGHLDSVYKNSNKNDKEKTQIIFDSDEFLRKFFNTFVKIPPFINTDLQQYTKEQLKKTDKREFYQNENLVGIITKAFRENPRQIKQFINTLLSHYLIALKRESGKNPIIKRGIVTGNLAFLAKFLIVRQLWPPFYKEVVENPKKWEDYLSFQLKGMTDFMEGTNNVETGNIRSFIYLKQSFRKLALSDIGDNLEIALKDNKKDEVARLFQEARHRKIEDEKISDFLCELLEDDTSLQQDLVNIINLTAHIHNKIGFILNKNFCEKVAQIISDKLFDQIYILDLDFIFFIMGECHPTVRKPLISRYIEILSQREDSAASQKIPKYTDYISRLARLISINRKHFISQKDDIRKAISAHSKDFHTLSIFRDYPKAASDFITSGHLADLIGTISNADLLDNTELKKGNLFGEKVALVLELDKEVDISLGELFLQKITELFNLYFQTPYVPERWHNLEEMLKNTKLVTDKYIAKLKNETVVDQLIDALANGINSCVVNIEKSAFISSLLDLRIAASEGKKPLIDQQVDALAQSSDLPLIERLFENINKKDPQKLYSLMSSRLKNRAQQDRNFFNFIWRFEDEDGKTKLLIELINSPNPIFALDKLKEVNFKVKGTKEIVKILLNKVATLPIEAKNQFYSAINGLKCGNDIELREQYFEQLKGLVVGQDRTNQQVAYEAYQKSFGFFSDSINHQLTLAIIEWLNATEPINSSHEFAIRMAILYWVDLSITHRDNLMNIIFDKLIAKTNSLDEINMGFEIVYQLSPKVRYNSYKPHFGILMDRLKEESNSDIKRAILLGLEKLKINSTKAGKLFLGKVKKMLKGI